MTDLRTRAVRHLGRYPRWYGVATLWVLGMAVLPVIELDPLGLLGGRPAAPAAAPTATLAPAPPPSDGIAPPPLAGAPAVAPVPSTTGASDQPPSPPDTAPLDTIPPELIDELFNLFPPPQALPDVPPELQPVVRALAPMATQGCTGVGLAGLVIAVVAPSADGVPLERILPYLAPATSVCASFPIPERHTVCAADEPLIIDLGGVAKTPPILGLGIDQLTAIEDVIAGVFGDVIPRLSDTARQLLDCRLV